MEILRAESNEFAHLKTTEVATSPSSSTIDDEDEDEDRLSTVSTPDEKRSKSPVSSPAAQQRATTVDYSRHRDRLAKDLKDYEDRWLAHRNFLLYTQAFSMKPEDRERLISQINLPNNAEENASQQQLFARLSKEERDRFLAAALYNQQQQQPSASNAYTFQPYPWTPPASNTATASVAQPSTTDQSQQPKSPSSDDSGNQSNSGSTTEWTFEEQFRQLYELSDEPKRKEFLDDLFAYMQKRGTPVNRIPIMAKHVLDLYELFRLVVGKGGLVEVINKKLWREVTKGLNLPSSITSAAFTLRTQYMKYLYPYECEKLQLSSPGELQAAIEGNRREGRRPSYAFEYSSPPQIMPPPPPPPASSTSAFLASPLAHRPLDPNHGGHEAMQQAAMAAALSHPFFLAAAAASSRDGGHPSLESSSAGRLIPSFDDHHHHHHLQSLPSNRFFERPSAVKRSLSPAFLSKSTHEETHNNLSAKKFASAPPPPSSMSHVRSSSFTPVTTASTTPSLLSPVSKLKIVAKESQSDSGSISISIELNGIAYQGTLYANKEESASTSFRSSY